MSDKKPEFKAPSEYASDAAREAMREIEATNLSQYVVTKVGRKNVIIGAAGRGLAPISMAIPFSEGDDPQQVATEWAATCARILATEAGLAASGKHPFSWVNA